MWDLIFVFILGAVVMSMVYGVFVKPIYIEQGRVEVASGLTTCALKEQEDHTTTWVCKPVKRRNDKD